MIESLNGGYVSLAVLVFIFFCLQVWWISLVIRNGVDARIVMNTNQTEDLKKRLEKIFSKTD